MKVELKNAILEAQRNGNSELVSPKRVKDWLQNLLNLLFPMRQCNHLSEQEIERQIVLSTSELYYLLLTKDVNPTSMVAAFFEEITTVYQQLWKDAKAMWAFDPAANSVAEIILAYPGFHAISVYRLANLLHKLGAKQLPRIMTEWAHTKTGIDIHPAAQIGEEFVIDHGTGVVIGATCIIGNKVKIYQGVTLGALSVEKAEANTKRHPTIEDNVIIYSGATILGGKTTIGRDSVIGGNVWLTQSVPPNSLVYHKSEIKIKDTRPFEEPYNFVI